MVIKQADDKTSQIASLQALQARPDASPETRTRIEREIRNIRAGMKGEAEAAYEIEFHYGQSKNHAIIHDLRIECDGRVAQIDHMVINRWLCIWVCESKHFAEGIAINEHGECSTFYGGKPCGVPSPFEQNRKHITVLESAFKTGTAKLPTRLGLALKPRSQSLVLVSKNARISRPKMKIDGMDSIIKNDQIKSFIDRAIDQDNNPMSMAKLVGQDTLENFARSIAAIHRPVVFNWAAKFGLPDLAPPELPGAGHPAARQATATILPTGAVLAQAEQEAPMPKKKLICGNCSEPVAYNVARFCWFNKAKFGGNVYCMECQKKV